MLAIVPGYDGSGSDETDSEDGDENDSKFTKNRMMTGKSQTWWKRETERDVRNLEVKVKIDDKCSKIMRLGHLNKTETSLNETSKAKCGEHDPTITALPYEQRKVDDCDGKNPIAQSTQKNPMTGCKASSYDGEGCHSSSSKLNTDQRTALKFLALMKRKEDELKELEGVEDLPKCKQRRRGKRRDLDNMSALTKSKVAECCGGSKSSESTMTPSTSNERTEQWATLRSFLGVNDHLKGSQVDHGDLGPKSGLEKRIDQAATDGDIDKAEELSNILANRDFAVRIAEAANARDYSKRKQEESEMKQAKRKKKRTRLAWGFEVKHRWEMKGNM